VVHEGESANAAEEAITLDQLHCRMGHISPGIVKKLVTQGFVTGVHLMSTADAEIFCESCVYAKATRKSVLKACEGKCAKKFGEEVHSDLWGPAPVETKGGRCYYVTFVDDYTQLTHLYLLRTKDEASDAYKQFEAWSANQLNVPIRVLHSNCGGEYLGKEFTVYLKSKGTVQKLTVHHTPQHNSVAERHNWTIVEHIRALLHASGLPKYLWGEAACHIIWLMNQMSTKAIEGKTPYEAALGMKPDLSGMCEWGEKCWICIEKGNKLGGHVCKGRWVGVDDESKGYCIYWQDTKTMTVKCMFTSTLLVHQLIVSRGRIGSLSKRQLMDSPLHSPSLRQPQLLPCLSKNPQLLLKPLLKANLRTNLTQNVSASPVNVCSTYLLGTL